MPRPIFEQRFGVEALYQDAIDILLPDAYGEAIDETDIKPVAQPESKVLLKLKKVKISFLKQQLQLSQKLN